MARVTCPFRPSRIPSLSPLGSLCPSLEQDFSTMSLQVIILSVSGKLQDPIFSLLAGPNVHIQGEKA